MKSSYEYTYVACKRTALKQITRYTLDIPQHTILAVWPLRSPLCAHSLGSIGTTPAAFSLSNTEAPHAAHAGAAEPRNTTRLTTPCYVYNTVKKNIENNAHKRRLLLPKLRNTALSPTVVCAMLLSWQSRAGQTWDQAPRPLIPVLSPRTPAKKVRGGNAFSHNNDARWGASSLFFFLTKLNRFELFFLNRIRLYDDAARMLLCIYPVKIVKMRDVHQESPRNASRNQRQSMKTMATVKADKATTVAVDQSRQRNQSNQSNKIATSGSKPLRENTPRRQTEVRIIHILCRIQRSPNTVRETNRNPDNKKTNSTSYPTPSTARECVRSSGFLKRHHGGKKDNNRPKRRIAVQSVPHRKQKTNVPCRESNAAVRAALGCTGTTLIGLCAWNATRSLVETSESLSPSLGSSYDKRKS